VYWLNEKRKQKEKNKKKKYLSKFSEKHDLKKTHSLLTSGISPLSHLLLSMFASFFGGTPRLCICMYARLAESACGFKATECDEAALCLK